MSIYLNKLIKTAVIPLIIMFSFSCKDMNKDNYTGMNDADSVKGLSDNNTGGITEEIAKDHQPIVEFIDDSTIKVSVPFKPRANPNHYVETIILMQGARTQIEKKVFTFNLLAPVAVFKLPDPSKKDYWVLMKCNKHDMWRASVVKDPTVK